MSELTKESFEQTLDKKLKDAVAPLATKSQVEAAEQRVIKRIDEAQEELARMTAAGFEDIQNRLDVTAQMKTFERKFQKLEEALHITL